MTIIKSAKFVISSAKASECPEINKPEYAFIGRSNVGKSSLINMLTDHKGLAKTSGKPGKTRLINHFEINEEWFLVDLPGYGYAKASKGERRKWGDLITKYIIHRENLSCLMVLIDSRHSPQRIDIEFLAWLGKKEIPFVIVFTKTDKITSHQLEINIRVYKNEMQNYWDPLPQMFLTSAANKTGRDEILEFINETSEQILKFH